VNYLYAYIILVACYLFHCVLSEIFMEMWVFIQKTKRIDLCVAFATKKCKKKKALMGLAVPIPPRNYSNAARIGKLLWTIHFFFFNNTPFLYYVSSDDFQTVKTGENC